MRDAIGSAWIFSICLTFIILFTCYLAISLNYAKAFRVKNHIVSMIEENEGFGNRNSNELTSRIESYLSNEGYTTYGTCEPYIEDENGDNWDLNECIVDGNLPQNKCYICLYRKVADNQKNANVAERSYYRVISFFKFDLPVISAYMPAFQVGGDSRCIYDFANGSSH